MNSYYFKFREDIIEMKAASLRLAVLQFLNEFYQDQDEELDFKFLGKDYYSNLKEYGFDLQELVTDVLS